MRSATLLGDEIGHRLGGADSRPAPVADAPRSSDETPASEVGQGVGLLDRRDARNGRAPAGDDHVVPRSHTLEVLAEPVV